MIKRTTRPGRKLKYSLKILPGLVVACGLVACTSTPMRTMEIPTRTAEQEPLMNCEWGRQKFNLCDFDTKDQMVKALLAEMTLDEKIGQMTQSVWHNNISPEVVRKLGIGSIIHTEGPVPGKSVSSWVAMFDKFQQQAIRSRLGIPLLIGVDAVHGQNTYDGAVIFPHNIGMAATRNMDLIQRAAEITAIEVAGTGFNWTFSPCIAMPQHEHWGRVYEGFSEDRDLTIAAVSASVRGYQGNNLAARRTIAATAKHYLADGATQGGVEGGDAVMSEQEMREFLLPPYTTAVDEGVAAIMVGFNSYNGVNMHQNGYLVNDVLKGELGFDGVVLTDWNGGLRFGAAHTVINAGIDIAMQPENHEEFMADLKSSILDQTVDISRIDDAVRRILRMKFKLGLFVDPFAKQEFSALVGSAQHRAVARQAVRESLVLLKSENGALPLDPNGSIAVVGAHGNNSGLQSGGWSIHWQGQKESYRGATTILDGIRAVATNVEYAEAGCYEGMTAETTVVVVGEEPYAEFKGDSEQLFLSDEHQELIRDCKDLDKQVVVILISGRVLAIEPELDISDAFIAAWLPGSEGEGIADFLFAVDGFKPKGKSPYSWPVSVTDLPLTMYDERALFKFGFGLEAY